MPDRETLDDELPQNPGDSGTCTDKLPLAPSARTLEQIIDLTGELEHLNKLVLVHLEKNGGFKGQQSYFTIVTPVLDTLEIVIRQKYRPDMNRDEMKLLIQDWIDQEIAKLR